MKKDILYEEILDELAWKRRECFVGTLLCLGVSEWLWLIRFIIF